MVAMVGEGEALKNAYRFIKEAGVDAGQSIKRFHWFGLIFKSNITLAVKLEGGQSRVETVRKLVNR